MATPKLFMILIGCKPIGRHTEQHDVFFTIGNSLKEIVPQIKDFWPDSGSLHLDAWREVTEVEGYSISILPKETIIKNTPEEKKLFFINLGGYKPAEFEEYHYKLIAVGANKAEAIKISKQTAFYKHTGFKGAESHIDDKYGIDVDDLYQIEDILPTSIKEKYQFKISAHNNAPKDEWHIGYTMLKKIS